MLIRSTRRCFIMLLVVSIFIVMIEILKIDLGSYVTKVEVPESAVPALRFLPVEDDDQNQTQDQEKELLQKSTKQEEEEDLAIEELEGKGEYEQQQVVVESPTDNYDMSNPTQGQDEKERKEKMMKEKKNTITLSATIELKADYAYVVAMHSGTSYVCGAVMTAWSFKDRDPTIKLIAMIAGNLGSKKNYKYATEALRMAGYEIVDMPLLSNPLGEPGAYNINNYSKLNVFGLVGDFKKLVMVDTDILFTKGEPLDIINRYTGERPAAFLQPESIQHNSGIVVLQPSPELLIDMKNHFDKIVSPNGGDQGYLQAYLDERREGFETITNHSWTTNVYHLEADKPLPNNTWAIHFFGDKPWRCISREPCSEPAYIWPAATKVWWEHFDAMNATWSWVHEDARFENMCQGRTKRRKVEFWKATRNSTEQQQQQQVVVESPTDNYDTSNPTHRQDEKKERTEEKNITTLFNTTELKADYAYVVAMHSGTSYVCGAVMTAWSFKDRDPTIKLIAMIAGDLGSQQNYKYATEALRMAGYEIVDMPLLSNPLGEPGSYNINNYSKLNVFGLVGDFKKLVMVDTDILFTKGEPLDIINRYTGERPAAFKEGRTRQHNSGIVVLQPSPELLMDMKNHFDKIVSPNGGDQGYLQAYLDERRKGFETISNHPSTANVKDVRKADKPLPNNTWAIHFFGDKPWRCISREPCSEPTYTWPAATKVWWEHFDAMNATWSWVHEDARFTNMCQGTKRRGEFE